MNIEGGERHTQPDFKTLLFLLACSAFLEMGALPSVFLLVSVLITKLTFTTFKMLKQHPENPPNRVLYRCQDCRNSVNSYLHSFYLLCVKEKKQLLPSVIAVLICI